MKMKFQLVLCVFAALTFVVVSPARGQATNPTAPSGSASDAQFVKVTTTMGDLVLELDRAGAQKTVENFLGYVGRGFYNGTIVHRVLKDHLIQGGGFLADGSPKPAAEAIANESNPEVRHTRGTVAMARSSSGPDTATSQFFINVADNVNLDSDAAGGGHAIFAKVVSGMRVVDSIRMVPVMADVSGEVSRPANPIIVLSVRAISAGDAQSALAAEAKINAAAMTTSAVAPDSTASTDVPKVAYVQITTSKGILVVQLDGEKAPISTANFLNYVDQEFYNGLIFHRVMNNFMIQGGAFAANDSNMAQPKTGNPPIKNEYRNGLKNLKGTVAMARLGNQPDSASSQFFINVVDNPALDEARDGAAYAVFGKIISGMDVVDAIKDVKTGNRGTHANVPLEPITITSTRRLSEQEAQRYLGQPSGGH